MAQILLLEDEECYAQALSEALSGMGHKVVVSKNVSDALEEIGKYCFDLFIVDLFIKKVGGQAQLGGISLINHLKLNELGNNSQRSSCPPILAISGVFGHEETLIDPQFGRAIGADMLLAKPFSFNELLNAVSELLAR